MLRNLPEIRLKSHGTRAKSITETGDNELFPPRGELDHFLREIPAPEEDIPDLELKDILDLERVRELNEAFARTNGIASTVVDLQGKPLLPPANHSRVCRAIRSTPLGPVLSSDLAPGALLICE